MSGSDGGVVQVQAGVLDELARRLGRAGHALTGAAGGVDRSVPPVPEDEHGVGLLLVGLDEARERFERRVGDTLRESGAYLASVAGGARQADVFLLTGPMPGQP